MASPLTNTGFSDALVILGAAGLVIPAFARARISPVIGFILVGLLVGPFGLGALVREYPWLYHITISDPRAIEPFAEFGIVLLLFSIGLELSFKRLWSMRRLVFGVGAAELIGAGAVIGVGLHLLTGLDWAGALALGIALALSSTALVLPIAGTSGPVGRTAFAMLLFEDLALVPIIFILGAVGPMAAAGGLTGFARVGGAAVLTVGILFVGGRFLLPRLFAQAARTKSPELFLAASLLVVIAASLATGAVGLSPIVGALIAGLLIAETDYHSEVEVMTAPFKGAGARCVPHHGRDERRSARDHGRLGRVFPRHRGDRRDQSGGDLRLAAARGHSRRGGGGDRRTDGQPVGDDADRARRGGPGAADRARPRQFLADRYRDRSHDHAAAVDARQARCAKVRAARRTAQYRNFSRGPRHRGNRFWARRADGVRTCSRCTASPMSRSRPISTQ